jgi:Clp protease
MLAAIALAAGHQSSQHCSALQIYTVNMAHSYGQACMLLAAGQKGKRFSIEHGQMMLQQPSVCCAWLFPLRLRSCDCHRLAYVTARHFLLNIAGKSQRAFLWYYCTSTCEPEVARAIQAASSSGVCQKHA